MKNTNQQNRGSALIFALIVVAVIAIAAGIFGKKALVTTWNSEAKKQEKIVREQTYEALLKIQRALTSKVQTAIDRARACNKVVDIICDAQTAASANNRCTAGGEPICFTANSVYNAAPNESFSVTALGESKMGEATGTSLFKVTTNAQSSAFPKLFRVNVTKTADGDATGSVGNITAQISIEPDAFYRFSYLVTGQTASTINLGPNTYGGRVGLFFDNPAFKQVIVQNPSGQALAFEDLVSTNVTQNQWKRQSSIDSSFTNGPVEYRDGIVFSAASPQLDLTTSFLALRDSPSTIRGSVSNPTRSEVILGGANQPCGIKVVEYTTSVSCGGSESTDPTTIYVPVQDMWLRPKLIESMGGILVASIMSDLVPFLSFASESDSYIPGSVQGIGGNGPVDDGYTSCNTTSTPRTICEGSACFANSNRAIYLRGSKTIVKSTSGPIGTVCEKATFISDGDIEIQSSIVMTKPGSQNLEPPENPADASVAFVSINGNSGVLTSSTMTQVQDSASGYYKSLGHLRAQGGAPDPTQTTVRLDASFVALNAQSQQPGQPIAPRFAFGPDSNLIDISSGVFSDYGVIQVTGSVFSPVVAPVRNVRLTAPNAGRLSGFNSTRMIYNPGIQSVPGFNATSSTQLSSRILNLSFRYDNLDIALNETPAVVADGGDADVLPIVGDLGAPGGTTGSTTAGGTTGGTTTLGGGRTRP